MIPRELSFLASRELMRQGWRTKLVWQPSHVNYIYMISKILAKDVHAYVNLQERWRNVQEPARKGNTIISTSPQLGGTSDVGDHLR
jgi:hypothetical protein